jgi:HEAT repeat protein
MVACCAVGLWLWTAVPKWYRTYKLREELSDRTTFALAASVADVRACLVDFLGHDVTVDEVGLEEAGITPETEIVFEAENLSFVSAFRLLLSDVQLGLLIDNDAIVITTKEKATRRLSKKASPVAWHTSIRALASPDVRVRRSAAYLLAYARARKDVVPALIQALGDNDRETRINAAYALGELQAQEAAPKLLQMMSRRDATECYAVVVALGKMGGPSAIPGLAKGLTMDDMAGPHFALMYLETMGADAIRTAKSQLVEQLGHKTPRERAAAAIGLGNLGRRARWAIPPLVDALEDEDVQVRAEAAMALAHIGPPRSAVPILRTLSRGDAPERYPAMLALRAANVSHVEAFPVIVERLQTDPAGSPASQFAITWLEERCGVASALLKTPEYRARGLQLVAEFKPYLEPVIPALVAAAQSGDASVRASARAVLEVIDPETIAVLDEREAAEQSMPLRE